MRIGFWGAGKMATALAQGFIRAGLTRPENVLASDFLEPARNSFRQQTGAPVTASNAEVAATSEVIVLAVKPHQVVALLSGLNPPLGPDRLLISIAAGVSLHELESALPDGRRVLRVMPNTPALVGSSATGYAPGQSATPDDIELTQKLFSSVGIAFQVPENLLDAVTGLSGSGPAYAYLIIEALSDAGVAEGLPRDTATRLAAQTLLGASRMVLETGLHPAELKDMVTSPGGTTIEAVHQLELGGVRGALMNAVRASARRSRELGNQ